MPTLSIVVNKQVPFRGELEEFSNRYYFQAGSNAITPAFVESVYNAVRDMEAGYHSSRVKFVGGWGGEKDQDAIFTVSHDPVIAGGRADVEGAHPEVCVMAESKIQNRVYLRKFYHTCAFVSEQDGDLLSANMRSTAANTFATLTDGSLPGGVKYCRPNGALATVPFTADPYFRTRQFKRRGKRPPTSSG